MNKIGYNQELSYQDHKSMIRTGLNRIVEDFIEIGYHLKQVRDKRLYKEDGYESINDFAQKEYGLSQSNTSRFISITECYSINGNSPKLLPEFEGYGSSKLSEMLSLSPEEMKLVSIQTTVAEIRTLKEAKKEAESSEYSDNYATSHKSESLDNTQSEVNLSNDKNTILPDGNSLVIEFFRDKSRREILKQLAMLLRDGTSKGSVNEAASEIINPSGHLMFKKGINILMFGVDIIKYSRFGAGGVKELTYVDFLHDIALTFYMAAEDPWVEFYGEPEPEPEPEPEVKEESRMTSKSNKPTTNKKIKPANKKLEINKEVEQTLVDEDDEQLPGQAVIEDYPELMPEGQTHDSSTKAPEEVEIVEADIVSPDCVYCETGLPLITTVDGLEVVIKGSRIIAITGGVRHEKKISFCPMCGKKLD